MAFWRHAAPEVVRKVADLDHMDSLASAGQALEVEPGLVPSGTGAICYRSTDDRAFCHVEKDARTPLTHDGASTGAAEIRADDHGFKWLIARRAQASYPSLVADLRAASEIFVDKGFGGQLLCAMTVFEGLGQTQAALIYLYRHGTFYPFAPRAERTRDNRLESAIRDSLEKCRLVESDPALWFPVWDAPGMRY